MKISYKSDRGGLRDKDEDSIAVLRIGTVYNSLPSERTLLLLADGMGGGLAGEIASKLAVKTAGEELAKILLDSKEVDYGAAIKSAVDKANRKILEYVIEDLNSGITGTTLVIAIISGRRLIAGNVGDSRLYLINEKEIKQITADHSPGGAILSRAVGCEPKIETDIFDLELKQGDSILLCCDGLSDIVRNEEIHKIVLENDAEEACNKLVSLANSRGGPDNISVILAKEI